MERNELISLIEKYLDGTATDKERQEVLTWYHSIDHSRIEIPLEDSFEKKEVRDRIRYKLEQYIAQERPVRKIAWHRWAAAAVILLIGGGSYFWIHADFQGTRKPGITLSSLKKDVPPGGNRATLTLANGKKVILDNVHNGQLAIQGKSKVMKVDSGLLAYNSQLTAHNAQSTIVQYNTLTTPRGGQYRLNLPDGTKVWLNAASSITFPTAFTGNKREVEVTGETYFEVAENTAMPFVVKKGDVEVQVLGTHFNVNAYEDESALKVTLLAGKVKIISGNGRKQSSLINPDEQAQVNRNGSIMINTAVDTSETVAWKNGKFKFDNTSLTELMRQLSRWYNVRIVYSGNVKEDANKYAFVGEIERDSNLSIVLKLLELGGVHFAIKGRDLIVMP